MEVPSTKTYKLKRSLQLFSVSQNGIKNINQAIVSLNSYGTSPIMISYPTQNKSFAYEIVFHLETWKEN